MKTLRAVAWIALGGFWLACSSASEDPSSPNPPAQQSPSDENAGRTDSPAPADGMDSRDAGQVIPADAGSPEPEETVETTPPPPPCVPKPNASRLSETCLYSNFSLRTVDFDAQEFSPAYALWSDGASKRRWIRLPRGAQVDTSNMDRWQFPVGTQVFKEFSHDGKLLETRLIERTGTGTSTSDYRMVSFIWLEDQSDAVASTSGSSNVLGTEHDVPSSSQCNSCHQGEPGRILGFSAVQLSLPGPGLTLSSLATKGLLSHPPPSGISFPVPGSVTESAALGYLHANCGHCHNPSGGAYGRVNMVLRVGTAHRTVASSPTYVTTVDVPTSASSSSSNLRVNPGSPSSSEVTRRMGLRGSGQMPPIGSEVVDSAGLSAVSSWIQGL